MRRLLSKICKALALLLLAAVCCTGCGGKGELRLKDNELLAVGDSRCTREEALIFLLSQHSKYSKDFGESIWSVELTEGSFRDYVKTALLDYLELLFLVDAAARGEGIRLSEAEEEDAELAAEAFMGALGQEQAETLGITRETAAKAYARFLRVQILYRQVQGQNTAEISDEEARAMVLQMVEIPASAGLDAARTLLNSLKEGIPAASAVKAVEGAALRKETVVRGRYSEAFDGLVFSMKKEQWSPIISEGSSYYLVQCLSPYDAEATAVNKAALELADRRARLQDVLEAYALKTPIAVNGTLWDSLSLEDCAGIRANFYDYTDALTASY